MKAITTILFCSALAVLAATNSVRVKLTPIPYLVNVPVAWNSLTNQPNFYMLEGFYVHCNGMTFTDDVATSTGMILSNLPAPGNLAFTAQTYSKSGEVTSNCPEVDLSLPPLTMLLSCSSNYIIQSGTDLSIKGSWISVSSPIVTNDWKYKLFRATTNWP